MLYSNNRFDTLSAYYSGIKSLLSYVVMGCQINIDLMNYIQSMIMKCVYCHFL